MLELFKAQIKPGLGYRGAFDWDNFSLFGALGGTWGGSAPEGLSTTRICGMLCGMLVWDAGLGCCAGMLVWDAVVVHGHTRTLAINAAQLCMLINN